jgi:S-adenosylmethionine synthetase
MNNELTQQERTAFREIATILLDIAQAPSDDFLDDSTKILDAYDQLRRIVRDLAHRHATRNRDVM